MNKAKVSRTHQAGNTLHLNKVVFHFQKDRLPPARSFYECELGKLTRANGKGWAQGRCPLHESKSGKSFSVNLDSGGFHCFGCEAKGGDLVAFLRLRYGLSFKEACIQLGCWDEDGPPVEVPTEKVPYQACDFAIDGIEYHSELSDEARNYTQKIRRFYRDAREQLTALGLEQAESSEA